MNEQNLKKYIGDIIQDIAVLPSHLGIIMDGNSRWAKKENKSLHSAYEAGIENAITICKLLSGIKLQDLTLYAFSINNWKRKSEEILPIMDIIKSFSKSLADELHDCNIKIKFIGVKELLDETMINIMTEIENKTKDNSGTRLWIAFNYGGRREICDGFLRFYQAIHKEDDNEIKDMMLKGYLEKKFDIDFIDQFINPNHISDLDLIIRTGGEQRISDFMTWRSTFSELYFVKDLWPDFNYDDLHSALAWYASIKRNFGSSRK